MLLGTPPLLNLPSTCLLGCPERKAAHQHGCPGSMKGCLGAVLTHHCPQSSTLPTRPNTWVLVSGFQGTSPWPGALVPSSLYHSCGGWGCRWRLGRGLGWAAGLVRCGVESITWTIINALIPLPETFFSALLCWFLCTHCPALLHPRLLPLGSSPRAGLVTPQGWSLGSHTWPAGCLLSIPFQKHVN